MTRGKVKLQKALLPVRDVMSERLLSKSFDPFPQRVVVLVEKNRKEG
jgi:hypothetical protein